MTHIDRTSTALLREWWRTTQALREEHQAMVEYADHELHAIRAELTRRGESDAMRAWNAQRPVWEEA